MRSVNMTRKARLAVACLLGATALTPFGVAAQTTWEGTTSNYALSSNWNPASVPIGSTTAIFSTGGTARIIDLSSGHSVSAFQFDAAAPAYTFNAVNGAGMSFFGAGIVNNSASVQTFNADGINTGIGSASGFGFNNSATAGNAVFSLTDGATISFHDTASAGTAQISVSGVYTGSYTAPTVLNVYDSGRLGSATVTASNGALIDIKQDGRGEQARVILAGAESTLYVGLLTSSGTTVGSIEGATGKVILANKQLTVGGNNQSTTFGGVISGVGGSIVKEGSGTWTLSGTNTYSGGTTIKGGTLSVANNASLGAAGGGVLIDGGTIRFGTAGGYGRTFTLGVGGGTFDTNGVAPNIANVTGTGALTKTGGGLLVITTVADYSGATHVQAGGVAGQLSSASAYTVDSGAALLISGNRTIASLAGAGDVHAGSNSDVNLTVGGNNTSTTFSGTFNDYSGTPSRRLSLTKVGSGTMTLTGGGNYSGGVAINDGILSISSDANLGAAAGTLAFGGGVLRTTADITMSRATTLNLRGLFDVATGTTLTQNGVIGGADGITKSGGGTLVLGAANTYGGQTTIEGGTLALSGAGSIVSGIVVLTATGATFDISAASGNRTIGDLSGVAGTKVVLGAHTLTVGAGNVMTFAGVITDVVGGTSLGGSLTKAGGNKLTLTQIQDYTGATTITGGTLALTGAGNLFASSGVTIASGATFDVSGSGSTYNPIRNLAGAGTVELGGNGLSVMNASSEFSGVINGTAAATLELRNGTLTLSGVSTYGGKTQIHQGATLALKGTGSIASSLYVEFLPNTFGRATIDIAQTTSGATVGGLHDASGDGAVVLGDRTLTISRNLAEDFRGVISGSGGLVLADNARQLLSGVNTYAGMTTIGAGAVLDVRLGGSIASSSGVVLNGAGAILDFSGANGSRTIKDLSGVAGTLVSLGSNDLTVGTANDTSFAGVIEGAAALIKMGSGTLTLSGANTYGYGTVINEGTISISSHGNLGTTGSTLTFGGGTLRTTADITTSRATTLNVGGGTFDVATGTTLTQNGGIDGSGGLTKIGAGTLVLGGTNTYGGGTTINAGVLAISSDANLGAASGGLTINGATLRFLANFNLAGSRAVTLGAGGGTVDTNGFATTISAAIGGAGGLTKLGAGTLTLSGMNGYAGATTINAGTLALSGNGSVAASSSVNLAAAGTTFDISGANGNRTIQDLTGVAGTFIVLGGNSLTVGTANSTSFAGNISGGGGLTKTGSGTLILSGTNNYTGGTVVSAGTLQGNATSLQGDIANNAAVVFDQATNGTYAGVMSGTGSLTKTGGGTLILSGINTYGGGTTVNGGALSISQDANLGAATGTLILAGGTLQTTANIAMSRATTLSTGGGTFDVATGTTFSQNSVIGGSGGLTKAGGGTMVLTQNNTYGGGTTISDGILQLGNGGTTGMIAGNVVNDGVLAFNRSDNITFAGDISGSGSVAYMGPGVVTLTGNSTYTGGTAITGGTVLAGSNSAFGAAGTGLTIVGGTVQATASFTMARPITLTTPGGTFDTNGNTLTVLGTISGTGGLTKQGAGTLELGGSGAYTGATTVNAGTLALVGAGSIATSSGVALTASGATFDISAGSGNQTIQDFTGVAGTSVVLGNNNLTVGTANNTSFAGSFSGAGGLTKQGSGTLTLESYVGYSGATTINAGTLAIVGAGGIGSSSLTVASGATFDISGSDNLENPVTDLAGGGTVKLGSNQLVVGTATGTFSGSIVDAGAGPGITRGALTIIEGTLTLSGASTYGGITRIYQGASLALTGAGSIADTRYVAFSPSTAGEATFDVSGTDNGAAVGGLVDSSSVGVGRVVLGSQTLTITGTEGNFAGSISGSGGLALAANAAQGLARVNSYTGATTVGTGATLLLYDDGSIASSSGVALTGTGASLDVSGAYGAGTIQDLTGVAGTSVLLGGNSLTVGTANDTTFAGVIADGGSNGGIGGSLVKEGSGTLILTGANTYTGGTTVWGGTLQGTTTSLQGNIENNASVVFNQSSNGTYAGNMTGSGALTLTGGGNLTLTGTNSYSGGTTVSAGILTGNTASLQGDIVNNSAVVFNQTTSDIYNGVMSGTGNLTKTGAGTLILTSNNTYTGGTIITGGILQLGNGGTTGMIAGDVINNGVLAFNRSDNVVFAGNISGSGSIAYMGRGTVTLTGSSSYTGGTAISGGTVQAGSDSAFGASGTTLTVVGGTIQATASFTIARPITLTTPGGTFDTNGNTLTLQGAISGTGGLTKTGTGTLILTGTNSYTGGTTVTAGILQGTTSSLQRNIVNNAAVVFDQSTDGSYGSVLSGTGSLTKAGSGNLTLTGTNTYTGGTTVSGGTLTVGTTNLQGNILNNATVVFDQDTNGTYAGTLSGTGGLTKTGYGNVTLTGANSYTGGTTVSGGTLTGDTTSLQGNIVNNANVVFNQGTDGTYADILSGTGGLTKSGAGNLTLTGANSYSGGTTVSGGTLTGTTSSLQGNIVNNAAVVFTGAGGSYAGNMTGTGSLNVSTTGLLILSGANAYTGGTTINGGTLQGNATSLQGNIVNNAALVFDQSTVGTYAGAISGTGSLTKTGAGQLILTGNNVVGGGTTVSAGLLTVNGSLTSSVVVGSGGMIGGSGTIIGQFASNGGTLAPGNSIGTLNVTGNFSQTGGVYQVEVNSAGQNDKIVASGTATIGGGATVQVLAASGTYQRNTTYTIVTATGGLTGTYSGVTSNLAFLTPSLSYDANNVYLLLEQAASAFASGAQTRNQYAVGTALDIASPTATGDFATVLTALASLDTQQGPAALNTISGQPYTGFGTVNVGASLVFMNALGQQVAQARNGSGPGTTRVALAEACVVACDTQDLPKWGAWISGLGGFGSVGGNTNAGTLTYNLGGAAVGVDYRLDPRFLVGLAVGYSSGRQWVNGFMGNGNADTYSAALYASFTANGSNGGGLYVDALAGYAYSDNRMQRVMAIPGLATRIASGQTGANQFLGQIEAGYRMGLLEAAQATLTPFVRFQTVAVSQNGFTESGAQSLNLGVAQQNTTSVRTVIGADLGANIPVGMARPLGVTIRLGWAHEYADTSRPMTAAFAGAPAVPFTVYGAQPLRDAAVVGLGLNAQIGASTSIYARYDGEITGRDDTHAISAGFRMTW
jgi:fibronectin-binding autotransporter adhesin